MIEVVLLIICLATSEETYKEFTKIFGEMD